MKKVALYVLIGLLIGALGIFVAARQRSAAETRGVVIPATPLQHTITSAPPTAPPAPTITPELLDATVSALATGLRELPHLNSKVLERLMGGATVDLLAVTEDREWVQATAYLGGGSAIRGWIQVDKLKLNVSLDDLEVDTETAFVLPPTRTLRPTALPLNERFIAHFVERDFENPNNTTEYIKRAGRGFLFVAIEHGSDGSNPQFGFISRINATQEERDLTLAHLDEAAAFIDPVDGVDIAYSGMLTITTNKLTIGSDGTWRRMWADGETWTQFIHTSTEQEVFIRYVYEEENIIKVFFTYLPEDFVHYD